MTLDACIWQQPKALGLVHSQDVLHAAQALEEQRCAGIKKYLPANWQAGMVL